MALLKFRNYQVVIDETLIANFPTDSTEILYVKNPLLVHAYKYSNLSTKSETYSKFDKIIVKKTTNDFTLLILDGDTTVRQFVATDFTSRTQHIDPMTVISFIVWDYELPVVTQFENSCVLLDDKYMLATISDSKLTVNGTDYTSTQSIQLSNAYGNTFGFSANSGYIFINNDVYVRVSLTKGTRIYTINVTSKCVIDRDNNTITIPFVMPLATSGTTEPKTEIKLQPGLITAHTFTNNSTLFTINNLSGYTEFISTGEDSTVMNWKATGNYRFGANSVETLKNYFSSQSSIYNKCLGYEVSLSGETLNVQFIGVYGNISIPSSATREDLGIIENPTITTDLTGCTVDIVSGTHYDYGSQVTIHINTNAGYLIEDKQIRIIQDNDDITKDCTVSDTEIVIPHIRGNIVLTIVALQSWTLQIKDTASINLTSFETSSIIKNIKLRNVGENVYDFKIGDTSHMFLFNLPSGKEFVGVGVDGNVIAYMGKTIEQIDLTEYEVSSKTSALYIILRDAGEIPSTFTMDTYNMTCEKNYVNKTNFITYINELTGTLRESCSITKPVITFQSVTVPTFNYVYIPNFNRYYFVTDIVTLNKDMYQVSLRVDVLMSYKDIIRSQTCIVARNEHDYNWKLPDPLRIKTNEERVEVVDISLDDNPFENSIDNADGLIIESITGKLTIG